MLKRIKLLAGRGDTIVEVMIVLAVLGLAIGISYATANRSLLNTRQAQENSDATEYVQSQVENLRTLVPASRPGSNPATDVFSQSQAFCIQLPAGMPQIQLYSLDSANPADPANCSFGSLPYTIKVYNCDIMTADYHCSRINASSDTLVVEATWPDVLGQGTDSVNLTYRDHADP